MTGPIFYIVLIFLVVAFPATLGWKLTRQREQFGRMAGAIIAGQMILTPAVAWMSLSAEPVTDDNPIRTMIIYGVMALMISIMTFVVLEIKKSHKEK
ncbi:hypothetical protein [Parasphingorhabdus sp.]|uniref:hypothetical protein n=1 Tax=Parasphingorhabdus sp. TaxID=2709688 RepID=UPI003D291798